MAGVIVAPALRVTGGTTNGTARRRCRSWVQVAPYGVHLMFGFTLPVQLKTAMLSQPLPLLLMSAGFHPLPVTAYQVGSQ